MPMLRPHRPDRSAATAPAAPRGVGTGPSAPRGAGTVRAVLTRDAVLRLLLGAVAVGVLALAGPAPAVLPSPVLGLLLAGIVAVIVVAAGGVVRQAEALAHRLGDPYGTLVLTLSIVVIEVVLIAAVMLGPGASTTIARDSVTAVSMIIMNLVLGLCLLVGGLRHGGLVVQRTGTSAYLAMLVVLGVIALALPAVLGPTGGYSPARSVVVAAATVLVYGVFLWRQTGAQAADFQEVPAPGGAADPTADPAAGAPHAASARTSDIAAPAPEDAAREGEHAPALRGETLRAHRVELLLRTGLLIATVLPVVLLSHDMAGLLDEGLARLGAPAALGGMLIALIVFTPESLTAVRAALAGEGQRVVNLCHGALVSTFALTVPAVLLLGLATGSEVVLAESGANLLLLGATLALAALSTAAPRVTALHGAVHLLLFVAYLLVLLQ